MIFTKECSLNRHKKTLEKTQILKQYPCDICGKHFCFEIALNKHKRNEHSKDTDPCDECDKIFYSNLTQNLNIHKKVIHKLEQFSCDECDKTFSYKQNLNEHKKMKH